MAVQFMKDIAKIDALEFKNCPSFELKRGETLKVELQSPPIKGLSQVDFQLAMKINQMKLAETGDPVVATESFTVDLAARVVVRDGAAVHLTPTEWRMLEMLVRHRGKLVGQRDLLQEVWGPAYDTETHYLRVYLAQLRRKLEPDPAHPRHLLTEAGMGYRFCI